MGTPDFVYQSVCPFLARQVKYRYTKLNYCTGVTLETQIILSEKATAERLFSDWEGVGQRRKTKQAGNPAAF